jgi:hypothetical protein
VINKKMENQMKKVKIKFKKYYCFNNKIVSFEKVEDIWGNYSREIKMKIHPFNILTSNLIPEITYCGNISEILTITRAKFNIFPVFNFIN